MGNPFENLTGLVNCQVMVKCRGLSIQLVNGGGPCLEGLCGLWVDLHMCIHAWLYTHTHIYQNKSSRKSAASDQWMGQMWRISLKGYCFEDWLRNNFPGKTSLLAKYRLSWSEGCDLLEREIWKYAKPIWRLNLASLASWSYMLFPHLPPSPATHFLHSVSHAFIASSVLSSVHID